MSDIIRQSGYYPRCIGCGGYGGGPWYPFGWYGVYGPGYGPGYGPWIGGYGGYGPWFGPGFGIYDGGYPFIGYGSYGFGFYGY